MITPPLPADEAERLAELRALNLLGSPPEERFDRIVKLAAGVLRVPIAFVALIDAQRQWFKAKCGLAVDETGRDVSFCAHTILQDEPLVIPDARLDERFRDNPLVVGDPHLRFYAGHPLRGPRGRKIGTFCVCDTVPRTLDAEDRAAFCRLAALAEHELGMVDLIETQKELLEVKGRLVATQARLTEELAEAAAYVRSLLPEKLRGEICSDWQFVSSSQLGGDLFGHHWLDDGHLAVYAFDVCGHGVSASLLSISVLNSLRRQTLPDTDFRDPAAVLAGLNGAFPMHAHGRKFTTVWYGVYERATRTLRYANAGHPPALLYEAGAGGPVRLGAPSVPVGAVPDPSFEGDSRTLGRDCRLYLLSDGAFEVRTRGGDLLMLDGLVELLNRCVPAAGGSCVARVLDAVRKRCGPDAIEDDFLLMELRFR